MPHWFHGAVGAVGAFDDAVELQRVCGTSGGRPRDSPFPTFEARSALAVMLLRALVLSLCTYWTSGVAAYFVVRTLRGAPPTLLAAVQQASRRSGYVLVASFLMSLLVTLGFLLMVVPASPSG